VTPVHNDPSSSRIESRRTTLFPFEFLEEHAEKLGVVERESKLQVPALVWTFVFGFANAVRAREWYREFREIVLMCLVYNIKQYVTH